MRKIVSIFILVCSVVYFSSCRKDKLITNSGAKLAFTQDSILFDTVFTSIGSTTKLFRVHNNNSGSIKISSIKLARGTSSFFRLNVDGVSGKSFSDIEIAAHDSIYVFVEVTIDPNNLLNPFIYRDSILFETNGNHQDVKLIAFGQNAYYHMPNQKIIFSNTQALYYDTLPVPLHGTDTWLADKPHLIYGYVVVDSTQTLVINPGAKIYVHNNGGIWVYRGGCIKVNGALNSPVTFQGDRLEAEYKDVPGQWDRIWINEGANNVINYAVIKNAFIGVHAGYSVLDGYGGNTVTGGIKHLDLSNTIIQNCSFAGIFAHYYNITGGNDVISNCGSYLAFFQYGGSYSFKQCTFANYWNQTNNGGGAQTRTTPSFFFNNYLDATFPLAIDSLWFGNCIMDGNLAEEFQFDTTSTASKFNNVMFDHTIMKTNLNLGAGHINTFYPASSDPTGFTLGTTDFHLPFNSAAAGTGTSTPSAQGNWFTDIEGNGRNSPPDLGAYKK